MLKGFTRKFKPLEILTVEQVEEIHRATLDVLWQTGVRFESKRALELFAQNGCKVDYEEKMVRFPEDLVEEAIRRCPSSYHVKARNPENDLVVGGDSVYFEASVGMRAIDLDTGEWYKPTLMQNCDGVKVLDALDNIHSLLSYCPYADIEGVPTAMQYTISDACRFRYSTKIARTAHVSGSGYFSMEMAHECGMGINANMEASPPLTFCEDAIENAFWACEIPNYSQFPIIFCDGDVMGATAPATFAGSLVTSSVELMSGIVMAQLIKPGKAVAVRHFVFPINMKHGHLGFGSIECALQQVAFNQLWRRYGIPIYAGNGGSFVLAKNIGYQTGVEKMQNLLTAAISGANVITIAGGLFAELTWSPELAVLDNELCGAVGRFIEGFEVSAETLAVNLINEIGPASGTYLGKKHTREWWQKEFYVPNIMDNLPYDTWMMNGKKNALEYAKERTREIIATHKISVPLTDDQRQSVDRIINQAALHFKEKDMMTEQEIADCEKMWHSIV